MCRALRFFQICFTTWYVREVSSKVCTSKYWYSKLSRYRLSFIDDVTSLNYCLLYDGKCQACVLPNEKENQTELVSSTTAFWCKEKTKKRWSIWKLWWALHMCFLCLTFWLIISVLDQGFTDTISFIRTSFMYTGWSSCQLPNILMCVCSLNAIQEVV